ncbi:MAG: nucleoside deaminase [Desulfosarcinaceae bacterium]|jgi:tRNA(adenine34) deaminase
MADTRKEYTTAALRTHERFMRAALRDARRALDNNEFPVGCVIVCGNDIVARGQRINSTGNGLIELDHAEIVALRHLQSADSAIDVSRATLYSTMEPCLMCYATILLTGIGRIVYAYEDVMGGSTGVSLSELPPLYRGMQVEIVPHILRDESLALMQTFFQNPQNAYWQGSLLERYTLEQA